MIAELRAEIVAALDAASDEISPKTVVVLEQVGGWTTWAVGREVAQILVTLPTLRRDVTRESVMRYWSRIVADATGLCPWCYAVADIEMLPGMSADVQEREQMPGDPREILPATVTMTHADFCPAQFTVADRGLFVPEAFEGMP